MTQKMHDHLDAGPSRREFLGRGAGMSGLLVASGGLSGLIAACGGDDDTDSKAGGGSGITARDVRRASGTVEVYGWSSYNIAANDAGRVKTKWVDIAGDAAQIPIKIRPEGSYDVFVSNAGQMEQYFATGRMAPIPVNLLSNYEGIDAGLRDDPVWKGPDGEIYAVPVALGIAIMGWDSEKVSEPKTVQDLLKPEYKNSVGLYDDYQMLNTVAQGLGLPQPPELTRAQFKQVTDFLEKLRPQVKTFVPFGTETQLFGRGDITVAFNTWFGPLLLDLQKSNPAIKTNFTSSVTYADAYSILKGGDLAAQLAWIDNAISLPAMLKHAGEEITFPAVTAAIKELPASLRRRLSSVQQVLDLAPVIGPYPVEAKGDQVSIDEAVSAWTDYKTSF